VTGIPYLTWRYLRHRPWRTLLLTLTVALVIFLPLAVRVFIDESSRLLGRRAESTPLLVGPQGSAVDLTLASLYFQRSPLPPMDFLGFRQLQAARQGEAVPLHVRFESAGAPIVGTGLEYFRLRGLEVAEGQLFTRLGDCVVGAELARQRGIAPGDRLLSSPENLFDAAGGYPLRMRVTGVLAPGHPADDNAVFVDLKTAWLIEGYAHGHEDLTEPGAEGVIAREDGEIRAGAALREFNEVTDDNVDSFHFHGDPNGFPVTSVIVFPKSDKARALLLARYRSEDSTRQITVPAEAVERLAETLFATRGLVLGGLLALALASALLVALVFGLSLRLRERELQTYARIGLAPGGLHLLKAADVAVIVAAGTLLALAGLWLLKTLAPLVLPRLL